VGQRQVGIAFESLKKSGYGLKQYYPKSVIISKNKLSLSLKSKKI